VKESIKQIRGIFAKFRRRGKSVVGGDTIAGPAKPKSARAANAKLLDMVRAVVDTVQPLLPPYQAAFYWYLFRQTILEGDPLICITRTRMRTGVVKQQRGRMVSCTQVRRYLKDLERIGAIREEGDSGHLGKVYRVLTPAEIEVCRNVRVERPARRREAKVAASELDYYNVRANRRKVHERDEYKCRYCGKQLTHLTATLDHVTAVAEGGGNELNNLVTACLECNASKQKRPVGDFLAERREEK
jgi:5-methylcytosine-specific restriction endonuclease McrA